MNYKLVVMLLALSGVTHSETFWCEGHVNTFHTDSGGNLYINGSWKNDYTRVCNTSGVGGVTSATCNQWFSMIMASVASDKKISLKYAGKDGQTNCSNLAEYNASLIPKYIMYIK